MHLYLTQERAPQVDLHDVTYVSLQDFRKERGYGMALVLSAKAAGGAARLYLSTSAAAQLVEAVGNLENITEACDSLGVGRTV